MHPRHRCLARLALGIGLAAAACTPHRDAPPDAASAEPPDAPAAPPDGPADAPVSAVTIDAVATTYGFTEVRQGDTVELVIKGTHLDSATAVTVGDLTATILSVAEAEIHATLIVPHGHAVGARALTVVAQLGSATRANAITLTDVVASPTGSAAGHGTYQSPFALCDAPVAAATGGDTIDLLAGAHTCDHVLELIDASVHGAGSNATQVTASVHLSANTATRALTGVALHGTLTLDAGAYTITDVASDVATTGISVESFGDFALATVTIDGYRYTGKGSALAFDDDTVTLRNATITSAAAATSHCISAGPGTLTIEHTTIEGCAVGVDAQGGGIDIQAAGLITIKDSMLIDDAIGIDMVHPQSVTITDTSLRDREDTPRPATTAVRIKNGTFTMTRGDITGYEVGIDGDGQADNVPRVSLDGATIDTERRGVFVSSSSDPGESYVAIRHCTIRGGSEIGVFVGTDVTADLGTAASPGGNKLSVSGGFALDVAIGDNADNVVKAVGTTLNGNDYSGQTIDGPVTQGKDYRIRDDAHIAF
jgi:hypothetical protein